MIGVGLRKLAKDYMHIWDADSEGMLDIYADKNLIVEYTHAAKMEGVEAYKIFLQNTYASFPDLKINLGEVICNKKESSITVFWNFSGTHQNNALFGVAPSGKVISINAMTVLTVKKGKVIHEKGIIDNLSMLMQLNA